MAAQRGASCETPTDWAHLELMMQKWTINRRLVVIIRPIGAGQWGPSGHNDRWPASGPAQTPPINLYANFFKNSPAPIHLHQAAYITNGPVACRCAAGAGFSSSSSSSFGFSFSPSSSPSSGAGAAEQNRLADEQTRATTGRQQCTPNAAQ